MRTVVVTGAAGGLGRAFAVDCAKRGYDLFLTAINAAGLKLLEKGTHRTISRILKGYSIYIPGFVNCVFRFVGALIPKPLLARLLYARWITVQEQWLKVS